MNMTMFGRTGLTRGVYGIDFHGEFDADAPKTRFLQFLFIFIDIFLFSQFSFSDMFLSAKSRMELRI